MNNTQAVILAAGMARRMQPLSNSIPKTLLKVGGKTIIQNIVDNLLICNVSNITVVTGYKSEELISYLKGNYPKVKFSFVKNDQFENTNNIVSMHLALEQVEINGDLLIIESDLVFDPALLDKIIKSPFENAALVDKYKPGLDGTVVSIDESMITGVIPPHLQGADFSFKDKYKTLNIYKFSKTFAAGSFKDLLRFYAKTIHQSYYELILGVIIYLRTEVVHAVFVENEIWAEIDDPNDLRAAKYLFEKDSRILLDRSYGGFWNYPIIDFCYIRNMYFPTPAMISELKENLHNTIHEYGSTQKILNEKIAYFIESNPEHTIALNGLSQIFPLLKDYFVNKKSLIPSPTFGEYQHTFPAASRYQDHGKIDLDDITENEADVIVFVNPNNPTGTTLDSQWIYEFAERFKSKTVLVDESFIDFSDKPSLLDFLYAKPLDNVILLKSLSKGLGVAGLRIGFSYSTNAHFNEYVSSRIPVWNMNSIAENFIEILLKHRPILKQSLEDTKADRTAFISLLQSCPMIKQVQASEANFIMASLTMSLEDESRLLDELLSQFQFYVKSISEKINDGQCWLRISVRKPEENLALVEALNSLSESNI